MLTQAAFNQLASEGYNRIPLVRELYADLDTPLSLYLKLANQPYSYLLESVVGGERFGRYSFIGLPAKTRLRITGQTIEVESGNTTVERHTQDPLAFIESFQARFRAPHIAGLPRFTGGLVGYLGYETIRSIETKLAHCEKPDPIGTPDMLLLLSEELVVVDNLSAKLYLIVYANPEETNAFERAEARLDTLQTQLRKPVTIPFQHATPKTEPVSEWGEEAFKAAVSQAKDYILAGDIMQVVLSQRMRQPFDAPALSLYRALRSLNPSPYLFYYDFGEFQVVGSSPEILVRQQDQVVTVRPIAGTRKRGATRAADLALAADLLKDPKEIAEHVMLMDLGRNDLGRVVEIGSVNVTDQMIIERYSHVMHMVSNVEGQLKKGLSNLDVLKATFPAGTVSGAAKVRAMEIIDELEPTKRGIYAGAVGYFGFSGDMDLAIAIRTAIIQDKTLFVQAGAGIVADSDPQAEWEETCNKARAVLKAAECVQMGLDSAFQINEDKENA